jgi:hypothetical protein
MHQFRWIPSSRDERVKEMSSQFRWMRRKIRDRSTNQ